MTACNTIENRRSLYAPKKADGPYTRALQDGSWQHEKSVNEEYQESKRERLKSKDAAPAASGKGCRAGDQLNWPGLRRGWVWTETPKGLG